MGIKGKTTFELTDVNTGNVEKIEDTNMVTNALQNFLETYGMFVNNPLDNGDMRNKRLWKNLLGGLFLFDKNIEENADTTFMPAGVSMVGNGSIDISNSGEVMELGSYNAVESGVQDDGSIKFVYDFSTQQANGTISCACLTSANGGYIGMGNSSGKYLLNSNRPVFGMQSGIAANRPVNWTYGDNGRIASCFAYSSYDDDTIHYVDPSSVRYNLASVESHWSNTKSIRVYKVRAGFKNIGLKDYGYIDQVLETYDIDIPQEIIDYMGTSVNYAYACGDEYEKSIFITFIKNSFYINKGSFAWVMKIDKNMKATAYKVTNNTGYDIYVREDRHILFHNGYMWVILNGVYKLVGIKYSDSTQIIDDNVLLDGSSGSTTIGRGLIQVYNYSSLKIYDIENHTCKVTNGSYSSYSFSNLIEKQGVRILFEQSQESAVRYILYKDERYLATINNLATPVVKTASKTMKVTYTISFEE